MTSIGALGFAVTAIVLAIRHGKANARIMECQLDLAVAKDALEVVESEAREAIMRNRNLIERRNEEIRSLYEQLAQCGDDDSRGRVAVAGLRRLLSAEDDEGGDGATRLSP